MKKKHHRNQFRPFYSPMAIMCASNTAPIDKGLRDATMAKFRHAFERLKADEKPDPHNWIVLTEANNLMDAMVREGFAQDPDNLMGDASGLMRDAARHMQEHGEMVRLDEKTVAAIGYVLDDFEVCFAHISARSFMELYNRTEKLLWDAVFGGKHNDVEVFDFAVAKKRRQS